ncbi:hypothetical protein JGU71_28300 [Antrihabitans sp. YC3-6]|uniref:Uncharacterized protein n=1 Tax=Antrihabitans stalagmiti TaxID=2799499 RepID=A0A934U799_9NOCA|nr:hypothetical protein [Antrihabitans stalagmiti]MBJ8342798.1 hypothetical protein [Antrihabitans stalagmiti]
MTTPRNGMRAASTIERFTAWAMCPRCKSVDCHSIRPPKPALDPDDVAEWEADHVTMHGWNGFIRHIPPKPLDESVFEVIRICKCGKEWGQA